MKFWQQLLPGEALPAFTDAGSYRIHVKATSPNYSNVAVDNQTLTIAKRSVTVKANSATYAYTAVNGIYDKSEKLKIYAIHKF